MTVPEAPGTLCGVIAPHPRRLVPLALLGAAAAAALVACPSEREADGAAPLHVLAAASTRAPVEEVAARFEETHGVEVRVSAAASSTLARQIVAGAPADVYVAADPRWLEWLRERDAVARDGGVDVAGNALVVVAPADTGWSWAPGEPLAAAFEGRLAMGDPSHVPGGRYGREALESLGAWEALERRLAPTLDAPSALAHVARGNAAAGIVYATDAAGRDDVRVVAAVPPEHHRPVRYVAVVPSASEHALAGAFLEALTAPEGRAVFRAHGFTEPPR